ncbi:hypothetical protein DID88_005498 [Monilinia fructigena]|uniref:Plastocyanin-like domain-containing protein n=1 Tax=Monilinia fructigena TaxID=38457 RepID=A0A395IZZ2_9HELO|nr:hypothetical protein DID88_005498 [Monilinia fructigena]
MKVPDTGNTVEVWLELVNTTASLDGVERIVNLVNGTFPGPTIHANWGDTVIVHLYNGLQNNGTGLHFHGIRQNYTNDADGVPSITQCPTAPGESITYKWRATQYGTTWYHSHFALQAWEGVLGGIIINGPATANYDEDAGMMFLNDWSHQTSAALYPSAETNGPPTLDNEAGKSYRIRLVNAAIDSHFKFMIDNHNLTVIAMDLVPIVPYSTQVLSMGMGQRYDVILTATETSENFWIRAIPQTYCSDNENSGNIKGILKYSSTNNTEPSSAYSYDDNCDDEDMSTLVPYLSRDAGTNLTSEELAVTVAYKLSRRDVAMLPASGYLVIAFYTDNPGAWLMHCHIGWHTGEGFALQIVERMSEIEATIDTDRLNSTCAAWESYAEAKAVEQDDSGV